ncbi:MAG: hypothetical protein ACPG8W_24505 [Candidatus Promineifilaceae bacterium]
MYPEFGNVIDSTAAARMNGYVCGYGSKAQLKAEIESFGLPEKAAQQLTRYFSRY